MEIVSPRFLLCCLSASLLCLSSCQDPAKDETRRSEIDKQNKMMLQEIQEMEKKIANVPPTHNLTERANQTEYNIQIIMRQEKEIDEYIEALNLRLAGLTLKFDTFTKEYPIETENNKEETTQP